jgi:hypothetical protein
MGDPMAAVPVTVVGAGVTVNISTLLVTPLAVAVICVVPGLTPVARPLALLICATLVVPLDQVKVTPDIVFPLLSLAVAVNCCVAFTAIKGDAGVTVIAATVGAVTVN